jgi:endonuclease/exonuclease/phosphatase family metal-dependent hydrolase
MYVLVYIKGLMRITNAFFGKNFSELAFTSILFLFFLQLFSDFVESTYIMCLMTLSLNENALSVLFFFAPIVISLFRKGIPNSLLIIAGELMIVCRVIEPFFDTVPRMIISGLGVGCFLIFFPVYLVSGNPDEDMHNGLMLGLGLAMAIASSVLLRTLNSTIDISTYGWFQIIGWVLAAIEAIIILGFLNIEKEKSSNAIHSSIDTQSSDTTRTSRKYLTGITLGLSSILFFVCFAFSSPVVISMWTEGDYIVITTVVILMLTLFAVILCNKPELISKLNKRLLWVWNALFVIMFILTILAHQIFFPANPSVYPIEAPPTTILHYIPLFLMLITFPIILIDFMLLAREIINFTPEPTPTKLGISFTLGNGLYMLLMALALIFTSVWGFIPGIGFLFRDMFGFIFLLVGIITIGSLFNLSKRSLNFQVSDINPKTRTIYSALMAIFLISTLVGAVVIETKPIRTIPLIAPPFSARVLTYNIQQGVNDAQIKNYDGQLELIRGVDADIIGLQETFKIAGNSDVVRYFANKLGLYSYFGPKGVTGTTGVALLSKYPIRNPRTIYHYNEYVDRKQTATIEAEITIGSHTFTVYVTHTFGRVSAKSMLQTDVLNAASGKSNVIFMGDFNFRPFSEPYNLTTETLNDSWWVKWPTGVDDQGNSNTNNIDLIFLSPGTTVLDCQYITDPQSDHPAYWADIQW